MGTDKTRVAIMGSGSIGTDLRIQRSMLVELAWMVGVVSESEALRGLSLSVNRTTAGRIDELLEHSDDFMILDWSRSWRDGICGPAVKAVSD